MCRPPDRRSSTADLNQMSAAVLRPCACLVLVEAILSGSRLVPTSPECSSAPASRLTSPRVCSVSFRTRPRVANTPCGWACAFRSFDSLSLPAAGYVDSLCGWVCSFLSFDLTLPAGGYPLLFPCCWACSYPILGLTAHIGCSRVQELTCGNLLAAMPSSGPSSSARVSPGLVCKALHHSAFRCKSRRGFVLPGDSSRASTAEVSLQPSLLLCLESDGPSASTFFLQYNRRKARAQVSCQFGHVAVSARRRVHQLGRCRRAAMDRPQHGTRPRSQEPNGTGRRRLIEPSQLSRRIAGCRQLLGTLRGPTTWPKSAREHQR